VEYWKETFESRRQAGLPPESEIANRLKIRAKLSLIVAASSSCVSVPVLNSGGMVMAGGQFVRVFLTLTKTKKFVLQPSSIDVV
jgi:hypothetical protein